MKKHLTHFLGRLDPVLVVIFVAAVLVRVWAFGSIPGGMNQDEASTAYDAYALLHYGIDLLAPRHPTS